MCARWKETLAALAPELLYAAITPMPEKETG